MGSYPFGYPRRLPLWDETVLAGQFAADRTQSQLAKFKADLKHQSWKYGTNFRVGQPFVTDEGNYIIDCSYRKIDDAGYLEAELNRIPGIVENGLFTGMCDQMIMVKGNDYIIRERTR